MRVHARPLTLFHQCGDWQTNLIDSATVFLSKEGLIINMVVVTDVRSEFQRCRAIRSLGLYFLRYFFPDLQLCKSMI